MVGWRLTSLFSALTLLVGQQEGHLACKKYGGWWRWALAGPDGVATSRMVGLSASVNLPLHHKVQTFSYGTHSIRTTQCPPPPAPIFYRLDALPATQTTVSKH